MKSVNKYFFGLLVSLFALSTVLVCHASQPQTRNESATNQTAVAAEKTDTVKTSVQSNNKLVVYYFHGNARCPTCYKLENYAKSEMESCFADVIKKGKLEWRTVNVEVPGNEHFNDDYKLYTKSVIISTVKDNKELSWKNLDKIWQLVHEESKYREYIRNEVKACLDGKCL